MQGLKSFANYAAFSHSVQAIRMGRKGEYLDHAKTSAVPLGPRFTPKIPT